MSQLETQKNQAPKQTVSIKNVLVKAAILFILANLIFAAFYPLPSLGKLSLYNHLFSGRGRLPYGDDPSKAYNLSLFNLEAMFASHELSGKTKEPGEYRVIFIGDSSTWGYLLPDDQTVTAAINAANAKLPDGRTIRAYNLGYPVMSLTKDLLILSYAMRYQPDLIVWPVTLESFPYDKQLFPPLLINNPEPVKKLIKDYKLNMDINQVNWVNPGFMGRTIIGARRPLADLLRLQIYGALWAATGIDQDIPSAYTSRQEDLANDTTFHNLKPNVLQEKDLAFDVIKAGIKMAGDTPVLLINEPMFISRGKNSDIRYNFYYPRWAYDSYRQLFEMISKREGWKFVDFWNLIPGEYFTNSAVHMNAQGTQQYAHQVLQSILELSK